MPKDRRFEKTEKAIRQVFSEMMDEMPLSGITVAEICRRADINRGTFYLHYLDVPDLAGKLGKESAEQVMALLDRNFQSEHSIKEATKRMISYIVSDPMTGKLLLSLDREKCFDLIYTEASQAAISSWLKRSSLTPQQTELIQAFLSAGVFEITKQLYENRSSIPFDDAIDLMFRLITQGLYSCVPKADD